MAPAVLAAETVTLEVVIVWEVAAVMAFEAERIAQTRQMMPIFEDYLQVILEELAAVFELVMVAVLWLVQVSRVITTHHRHHRRRT